MKQNAALVEFKLASNSSLRRNLEKQVEVYAEANQTNRAIKVIPYFSEGELEKVTNIRNLSHHPYLLIHGAYEEQYLNRFFVLMAFAFLGWRRMGSVE